MNLSELEGQRLADRFQLGKLLGQGGYGAVFEAEQISMGRRCAVKVMAPHRISSPETVKRFELEARNTSRLNHPNTVIVYDFGRDSDTDLLFLAMEFLEGVDLNRRVNEMGPMTLSETVHVVNQMAGSLQDAHDQGLVHRDIKPQNVMITTRGADPLFVKVIDFGITKALKAAKDDKTGMGLTETGMVLGTPQYMSPEQLRSYDIDGRSDQYSVAISVYRMLTGRTPFGGDTPVDIALKHITEMPLPLRTFRPGLDVPPQFERVLLKALSKEREDRFATVMEFAEALAEAADFDGTVVSSATAPADESWAGKPTGMMDMDPAVEDGGAARPMPTGETRAEPVRQMSDSRSDQVTTEDDIPGGTMVVDSYSGVIPVDSPDAGGELPARTEATSAPDFGDPNADANQPVAKLNTVRLGQADVDVAAGTNAPKLGGGTAAISKADFDGPKDASPKRTGPRKGLLAMVGGAFVLLLISITAAIFVGGDGSADGDLPTTETSPAAVEQPSFAKDDDATETTESAVVVDTPDPTISETEVVEDPEPSKEEELEETEAAAKSDVEKAEKVEEEEPEPKKVEKGTARVFIMPWGTLYVDGRKYGDKPRQRVRLAPGTYNFELRQDGKVKDSKRARVSSGRSVTVQLNAN